jgi:hypothetical protein
LCTIGACFSQWKEEAEMLTPYATGFRYPGDVLNPEKDEAEQALAAAEAIVNFVIQLLPQEANP